MGRLGAHVGLVANRCPAFGPVSDGTSIRPGDDVPVIEPVSSEPTLLVLHAVRLLGFADEGRVAARFALDRGEVVESLEDFEAFGWVRRSEFAGMGGWSLTDAGRAQDCAQLAAELDAAGARPVVAATLEAFEQLNARFLDAVTRWQLHPMPGDPLAANDHSDLRWDDRVIADLVGLGSALDRVCTPLAAALARFNGYAARYATSADRVRRGETRWVDALGVDSCHVVWIQLHEDLLATLGVDRAHR